MVSVLISSGLGLAITLNLVKSMGGDLTVESHLGVGTTVTFYVEVVNTHREILPMLILTLPATERHKCPLSQNIHSYQCYHPRTSSQLTLGHSSLVEQPYKVCNDDNIGDCDEDQSTRHFFSEEEDTEDEVLRSEEYRRVYNVSTPVIYEKVESDTIQSEEGIGEHKTADRALKLVEVSQSGVRRRLSSPARQSGRTSRSRTSKDSWDDRINPVRELYQNCEHTSKEIKTSSEFSPRLNLRSSRESLFDTTDTTTTTTITTKKTTKAITNVTTPLTSPTAQVPPFPSQSKSTTTTSTSEDLNPEKTVLVVDDNGTVRMLLRMMIEKMGWGCVCAQDGMEAYRISEKEKFDVIVMDMQMPIYGKGHF